MECFCDYDPPQFYVVQNRTANKQHKCWECQRPIAPGEKYEETAGKWRGLGDKPTTFKTCSRCLDLRDWVKKNVPCVCWGHGNMIEDAGNAIGDAVDRAPLETRGLRMEFLRKLHAVLYHERPRYRHQRRLTSGE